VAENYVLLGYDASSMGDRIPAFRGNAVSRCHLQFDLQDEETSCLETYGSDYPLTKRHISLSDERHLAAELFCVPYKINAGREKMQRSIPSSQSAIDGLSLQSGNSKCYCLCLR
jgi:hypothetical protein